MTVTCDIPWPVTLPLPFVDYSGAPRNTTLVAPGESAGQMSRSRFQTSYSGLSVSWILTTPAEKAAFETFYTTTLYNGTAAFEIELRFPKNSELTAWMVRFSGDGYDMQWADGNWVITAALDLLMPMELPDLAGDIGSYYSGALS